MLMATIFEIKELLYKHNIAEGEHSAQVYEYLSQFNPQSLDRYIENSVFLKKELDQVCTNVTLQQIYYIIATSNRKMLANMKNEFDALVKQTSLDHKVAANVFKTISKDVLDTTDRTDKEIANVAERFVSDINKVKEIANSFKAHLDEDIATELYTNCIKRMQTFYTSTNPTQLKNLIYYLLNNVEGINTPKAADLLYVSERCASFYSNATAEKVENISKELKSFAQFIYNKFNDIKTDDNKLQVMQYQTELRSKDLRNILLTTPTVFTENPTTITFNIDLIKGLQPLGELFNKHNITPNNAQALEKFKNITLNFSAVDMQKLYTGNLSALSTSPNVLLTTLQYIDSTASQVFGDNILPEEYLSPETFAQIQLIHKLADSNNTQTLQQWTNNLELLGQVIPQEKLKKYFLSNFKLATVPTDFVKKQVADTILSCSNSQELEAKFDRLINKNFFWDAQNKDNSKPNKNTSIIDVPKYRVGNKKADPLAFGLDTEKAVAFLSSIGYTQEVINVWLQNQNNDTTSGKTAKKGIKAIDVETINQCNEILNLIRNINTFLDTKPSIAALYQINVDITGLYNTIQDISSNTRNMDTSTKGLIVNVKNSFNDLSTRYNTVISKIQASSKDDLKKLNSQYNKLKKDIDAQYQLHQKYKNNVPAIISDQSSLIQQQTEVITRINGLQQMQEANRQERFERINKYSARVHDYYTAICQRVENCLDEQLLDINPVNQIALFNETILDENKKYLLRELGIDQYSRFTGEIFLQLKRIQQSPKLKPIYEQVKQQLEQEGIMLDVQLEHTQPENFHGDMLSETLIKEFLGPDYNEENAYTIRHYNGILNSAWRNYNSINSKIEAQQAILRDINDKIAELKTIINTGFDQKKQGLNNEEQLLKLQQEKQRLQTELDQLKGMYFNR